jgi:hypothetical protein
MYRSLYSSKGALLFVNRERNSHHICHIVSLSVVSVLATAFKRIIYGTQFPQSFTGIGNSALWVVTGTLHSKQCCHVCIEGGSGISRHLYY